MAVTNKKIKEKKYTPRLSRPPDRRAAASLRRNQVEYRIKKRGSTYTLWVSIRRLPKVPNCITEDTPVIAIHYMTVFEQAINPRIEQYN
jgi:hypothetical protein